MGKTFGEGELEETGAFGEGVREDKQRRAVMATVERDYQSSKVVVASMEESLEKGAQKKPRL